MKRKPEANQPPSSSADGGVEEAPNAEASNAEREAPNAEAPNAGAPNAEAPSAGALEGEASGKEEFLTLTITVPPMAEDSSASWIQSSGEAKRYAVTKDEVKGDLAALLARTRGHTERLGQQIQARRGLALIEGALAQVQEKTAAHALGLDAGDRILVVDGRPITMANEVRSRLQQGPHKPHVMGALRGGQLEVFVFRQGKSPEPGLEEFYVFGAVLRHAFGNEPEVTVDIGVGEALENAVEQTWDLITAVTKGIVMLVTGQVSLKSLGGPIAIFSEAGKAFDHSFERFVRILCFISVNLGIVNLLPVPVLDGGYLLMFGIEAVRRKPLSVRTKELALRVGLIMLLALMATAILNDIIKTWG